MQVVFLDHQQWEVVRYHRNGDTYQTRQTRRSTKRSASTPISLLSPFLQSTRNLNLQIPSHTFIQLQSLTQKPHVDIYDPLRHVPPGKKADFSTLRSNIYEERIKPLRESVNRAKEGKPIEPDNQASKGERDAPRGVKKQRSMQQNIIMLSSSPTALVTMWNVKKLLEEGE